MTAKDPGNFQKQYNSRITGIFSFSLYRAETEICWAAKEQNRRASPEILLRNPHATNHRSLALSSRRQKKFARLKRPIQFECQGFPENRRRSAAGMPGDANAEVVRPHFPRAIFAWRKFCIIFKFLFTDLD